MYTICDDWRAHQSPYVKHVPSYRSVLICLGWDVRNATSITNDSISLGGGHGTLLFPVALMIRNGVTAHCVTPWNIFQS